jgi:orotidine-5'-phosphate decarboxylase
VRSSFNDMTSSLSPIILALDVDQKKEALEWVRRFGNQIDIFKVGLQLFSKEGKNVIEEIISQGKKVFVDLKLHDIPNTVGQATRALAIPGVEFLTIHACGGSGMIKAAAENLAKARSQNSAITTKILAVTVLTSMDDNDLREIGINHTAAGQVLNLARIAKSAGAEGVVASPQEVRLLRSEHGRELVVVTPGVRFDSGKAHDQKRVMTPIQAIQEGSDFLVMGRSLLDSANPEESLETALKEIRAVRSKITA